MLMIGTAELAKRLYETWRTQTVTELSNHPPEWDEQSTYQRRIWRKVAERAAYEIATAAGAR
jgi:hypothetical protein